MVNLDLTQIVQALPLPWIVCFISWVGFGYAAREMWKRSNDLQDKNLSDLKESSQRLAELNQKMTDTLNAVIAVLRSGGK